jgi:exodeoxyribonuclease VII large subunit
LADFAADRRAPTPSAAAEAVAPILDDLIGAVHELLARQERAVRSRVRLFQHELAHHCRALPIMMLHVQRHIQRVDDALGRLPAVLVEGAARRRERALKLAHAVAAATPLHRVWRGCVLVPQLLKRLEQRMLGSLAARRHAFRACAGALDGLSPLNVLARGYAILETYPGGRPIQRVREIRPGDTVQARLADGRMTCDVRDVIPESS